MPHTPMQVRIDSVVHEGPGRGSWQGGMTGGAELNIRDWVGETSFERSGTWDENGVKDGATLVVSYRLTVPPVGDLYKPSRAKPYWDSSGSQDYSIVGVEPLGERREGWVATASHESVRIWSPDGRCEGEQEQREPICGAQGGASPYCIESFACLENGNMVIGVSENATPVRFPPAVRSAALCPVPRLCPACALWPACALPVPCAGPVHCAPHRSGTPMASPT